MKLIPSPKPRSDAVKDLLRAGWIREYAAEHIEKVIAAAVEAERTRIEAVSLRNVDADWKHALIEDIRARGGSNG